MSDHLTLCTTDRCPLATLCSRKLLPKQTELGRREPFAGGEDCPDFVPHHQQSFLEKLK